MRNIYFYIIGTMIALLAVMTYFFPRISISKKVEAEFYGREKDKKKYLLHVAAHLFLTGVAVLIAGMLPENLKLQVVLPVLVIILVSGVSGNKRYLGRWLAREFFKE